MALTDTHRRLDATGQLEVRCRRHASGVVIELSGVLDRRTAPSLTDILDDAIESDAEAITVDLGGLRHIDNRGVAALLLGHLQASSRQVSLAIVPGSPQVQQAIERINGPFIYT